MAITSSIPPNKKSDPKWKVQYISRKQEDTKLEWGFEFLYFDDVPSIRVVEMFKPKR